MSSQSSRKLVTVFKDMNSATDGKLTKKGLSSVKTEASSDKENLIERGYLTETLKTKTGTENVDTVKERSQKISEILSGKKKLNDAVISEENSQSTGSDMKSRSQLSKEKVGKITEFARDEKKKVVAEMLSGKNKITAEDLTSDDPGQQFWKLIAEKRRLALSEALDENKLLHKKVEFLEDKVQMLETALAQSTEVIDLLNEIVAETEEPSAADLSSLTGDNSSRNETKTAKTDEHEFLNAFGDDTYVSDDSEDD